MLHGEIAFETQSHVNKLLATAAVFRPTPIHNQLAPIPCFESFCFLASTEKKVKLFVYIRGTFITVNDPSFPLGSKLESEARNALDLGNRYYSSCSWNCGVECGIWVNVGTVWGCRVPSANWDSPGRPAPEMLPTIRRRRRPPSLSSPQRSRYHGPWGNRSSHITLALVITPQKIHSKIHSTIPLPPNLDPYKSFRHPHC